MRDKAFQRGEKYRQIRGIGVKLNKEGTKQLRCRRERESEIELIEKDVQA